MIQIGCGKKTLHQCADSTPKFETSLYALFWKQIHPNYPGIPEIHKTHENNSKKQQDQNGSYRNERMYQDINRYSLYCR